MRALVRALPLCPKQLLANVWKGEEAVEGGKGIGQIS